MRTYWIMIAGAIVIFVITPDFVHWPYNLVAFVIEGVVFLILESFLWHLWHPKKKLPYGYDPPSYGDGSIDG